MRPNPQETADLVTLPGEIYNGKLFFCAVKSMSCIICERTNVTFNNKYKYKTAFSIYKTVVALLMHGKKDNILLK